MTTRWRGLHTTFPSGQPYNPTFANPTWFVNYRPASTENNAAALATINAMLKYMDPGTQWQTAQFLAQSDPTHFGAYAGVAQPPIAGIEAPLRQPQPGYVASQPTNVAPGAGRYLSAARLQSIATALDPTNVARMVYGIATPTANQVSSITAISGPLQWVREYLSTAAQAMPATPGGALQPRATRQAAAAHLQTLEQQAQLNTALTPYIAWAQNLVNPQFTTRPALGGVGYARSVYSPQGDYTRAGVGRNLWLT